MAPVAPPRLKRTERRMEEERLIQPEADESPYEDPADLVPGSVQNVPDEYSVPQQTPVQEPQPAQPAEP